MDYTLLVVGLLSFLGGHSVSIFARPWRDAQAAKLGEIPWKGLYAVVALLTFGLLVWGYGATRINPIVIWTPPDWTRHVASLLTLPAFILIIAAYVPGDRFKSAVGHPLLAGTMIWALAHLLANGNLGDVLLFGGFLIWAIADFISARRRDRAAGKIYVAGPLSRTIITVIVGIVAWAAFARFGHQPLIGVSPFAIT
ncbi:MAG: NnrU family protein [Azovibrio sp.]|uniref:NnrU family protein n=1 Tax=Azovibrio sp. TaxID=1872673 RepID=UPI003C7798E4